MENLMFENHIVKQFDEDLEEIRSRLMEMGGKVEQQLQWQCELLERLTVLLLKR